MNLKASVFILLFVIFPWVSYTSCFIDYFGLFRFIGRFYRVERRRLDTFLLVKDVNFPLLHVWWIIFHLIKKWIQMSRFCKVNFKNQTRNDSCSLQIVASWWWWWWWWWWSCLCFIDFSTTTRSSPLDDLPSRTYQSCEHCEKHTHTLNTLVLCSSTDWNQKSVRLCWLSN